MFFLLLFFIPFLISFANQRVIFMWSDKIPAHYQKRLTFYLDVASIEWQKLTTSPYIYIIFCKNDLFIKKIPWVPYCYIVTCLGVSINAKNGLSADFDKDGHHDGTCCKKRASSNKRMVNHVDRFLGKILKICPHEVD